MNGLGKTAALYSYPFEDNCPLMRETLLDMWARWDAWLDRYVKNHGKTPARNAVDMPGSVAAVEAW